MANFKVIIVGGSVAGLSLANILERYGIDFVVLEKHETITPEIGSALGLLPNGIKILSQLGIYDKLAALNEPSALRILGHGPDGKKIGSPMPLSYLMETLTGYPAIFLERWQIIKVFYETLRDKSKVWVASKVYKIDQLDDGVVVELEDGTSISGDIVVGADGVHSRMREEIWRIADKETQGQYRSDSLRVSIQCEYRCLFGIATRPKYYPGDDTVKAFHKDRSFLFIPGSENKLFFFAFRKNPKVTVDRGIPRYTQEDCDALVKELADDIVFDNVTFKNIFTHSYRSTLVPVEEYVLAKCFYKRAVLIGDSFHKLNPLGSISGNIAIESAGLLADLLKSAINDKSDMSNETIQGIFTTLQEQQKTRSELLGEVTRGMIRLETLASPVLKFLRLGILNDLELGDTAGLVANLCTPSQALKHLPKNYKRGPVLPNEEVKANPHKRPLIVTWTWVSFFLSFTLMGPLLSRYIGASEIIDYEISNSLRLYHFTITFAVTCFWAMESYRSDRLITPLASPIPYIVGSGYFGWHIVLPLSFIFYILLSGKMPFYYPTPRALDPSIAQSLPVALSITYIALIPIISPYMGFNIIFGKSSITSGLVLTVAHYGLLVGIYGMRRQYQNVFMELDVVQRYFQTRDMKSLGVFSGMSLFFSGAVHVGLLCNFATTRLLTGMSGLAPLASVELFHIVSLSLSIILWCLFTVWDMRRVNLTNSSLLVTLFCAVTGSILVGPAAVLSGLWWWREASLESGRHKEQKERNRLSFTAYRSKSVDFWRGCLSVAAPGST